MDEIRNTRRYGTRSGAGGRGSATNSDLRIFYEKKREQNADSVSATGRQITDVLFRHK